MFLLYLFLFSWNTHANRVNKCKLQTKRTTRKLYHYKTKFQGFPRTIIHYFTKHNPNNTKGYRMQYDTSHQWRNSDFCYPFYSLGISDSGSSVSQLGTQFKGTYSKQNWKKNSNSSKNVMSVVLRLWVTYNMHSIYKTGIWITKMSK